MTHGSVHIVTHTTTHSHAYSNAYTYAHISGIHAYIPKSVCMYAHIPTQTYVPIYMWIYILYMSVFKHHAMSGKWVKKVVLGVMRKCYEEFNIKKLNVPSQRVRNCSHAKIVSSSSSLRVRSSAQLILKSWRTDVAVSGFFLSPVKRSLNANHSSLIVPQSPPTSSIPPINWSISVLQLKRDMALVQAVYFFQML